MTPSEIIQSVAAQFEAGTLTREGWLGARRELEGQVEGDEEELVESLILYADPSWVEQPDDEDEGPLVSYAG